MIEEMKTHHNFQLPGKSGSICTGQEICSTIFPLSGKWWGKIPPVPVASYVMCNPKRHCISRIIIDKMLTFDETNRHSKTLREKL